MAVKPVRLWLPAVPGVLFVLFSFAIPILASDPLLNADGDPARHVRHGQVVLEHGAVIRADPFSHTRPGALFVGFEYGSQVLMAASVVLGGLAGLVGLATLLIALSLSLLGAWLLRRGVDPLLAMGSILLVAVLTSVHWIARPHLMSWPLTLCLFFLLERPTPMRGWPVALLFVVWANLHGAFVYGWLLLGLYLTGALVEAWVARREPEVRDEFLAQARRLTKLLFVAIVATIVNPYGWRLPWHVIQYFRDPYIRQTTQEFFSPNFHSAEMQPLLVALVGTVALLSILPRPRPTHLIVILAHVGLVLLAQRNVTFFALVAVPLLVLHAAPWWNRTAQRFAWAGRFAENARSGVTTPYVAVGVLWLGVLVAGRGVVGGRSVVPEDFNRTRFPVAAVAEARQAGLEGRLFHDFMWGGYLLYGWPETRVFIDGGTDFYGGALIRTYRSIMGLEPGWRDSLDTREIGTVLTRPRAALAGALDRDAAWLRWYCDSVAVLFARRTPEPPAAIPSRLGCPLP